MDGAPDPAEAKRRYAKIAPTYARRIDQRFVKRMRSVAVRRLELRPGDHVLDLGCGTGASSPFLVGSVGPAGRVTGIELSDEMAAIAHARVTEADWDNVEIIVGEAATHRCPQRSTALSSSSPTTWSDHRTSSSA